MLRVGNSRFPSIARAMRGEALLGRCGTRRHGSDDGQVLRYAPGRMPLEDLVRDLIVLLGFASSVLASGHALLWKRDPRATLGWIGLCLTVPFAGPLVYLMFGVNRVRRRALAWQQEGRRIPGGSGAWRAAPPV